MTASLVFEETSRRFGPTVALEDVSFAMEPGEIFGFLGPNGAGKSTAISIAMGFLRASSGGGTMLGRPFARARSARARVGYVADAPSFFPGNAMESVLLAARLNETDGRMNETAVKTRAHELLRALSLPAEGQQARKMSRGMQQKLGLAQALVTRPELLILDEPTSALDPPSLLTVRAMLEEARDRGAAVFLSSHQLQEVEQVCDRVAFLEGGRLLQVGSLETLLREGAMAEITLRGLESESAFASATPHRRPGRGSRVRTGDLVFTVSVAEQQSFLERAWYAGAELVAVERQRQTLEDLFAKHRSAGTGNGGSR